MSTSFIINEKSNDTNILKQEIEEFNPELKLADLPVWLTSQEKRKSSKKASILVYIQENSSIPKFIYIGGEALKTYEYIDKRELEKKTLQCIKCQRFGHVATACFRQQRY